MILYKPFDKNKFVEFDPKRSDFIPEVREKVEPVGNFHIVGERCIALYCKGGKLFLQIDSERWDLSSGSVAISYFHDFEKKTTTFEVDDGTSSARLEYDAWWSEIPGFQPLEPEMDSEEDFLAYVVEVWRNRSVQKSLIERWV